MTLVSGNIVRDTDWASLGTPGAGAGTTTNGTNWTVGTYTSEFTQGGCYHVRVNVAFSGTTQTANALGILPSAQSMCNLPNPPVVESWVTCINVRSGSDYCTGLVQINTGSGTCILIAIGPSATLVAADSVNFSFTYAAQGP